MLMINKVISEKRRKNPAIGFRPNAMVSRQMALPHVRPFHPADIIASQWNQRG